MVPSEQSHGDQERFAGWVREHGRAVRGYLLGMVRRADVADDLVQEVFCRAWQGRQRYQEQGHARAYLLRIADRLVCDRGRAAGRETALDEDGWRRFEPAAADDPAAAVAAKEAAALLADALDRLSAGQRRVLLLRYYGQFSFREIAEMTGTPLGTALSHCQRGLEALRKILAEKAA
jgi:RNA polymerase sigma-70 factor (ECF subfamily)